MTYLIKLIKALISALTPNQYFLVTWELQTKSTRQGGRTLYITKRFTEEDAKMSVAKENYLNHEPALLDIRSLSRREYKYYKNSGMI